MTRQPSAVTSTMSSMRTPPEPGHVHAGLHRDDGAGRQVVGARRAQPGPSWISRPTPWPSPCGNRFAVPASSIDRARGRVDVAGRGARAHGVDAGLLRLRGRPRGSRSARAAARRTRPSASCRSGSRPTGRRSRSSRRRPPRAAGGRARGAARPRSRRTRRSCRTPVRRRPPGASRARARCATSPLGHARRRASRGCPRRPGRSRPAPLRSGRAPPSSFTHRSRSTSSPTGRARRHPAPPRACAALRTVTAPSSNPSRRTPRAAQARAAPRRSSGVRHALEVGHLPAGLLGVPAVGEEHAAVGRSSAWPFDPVNPVRYRVFGSRVTTTRRPPARPSVRRAVRPQPVIHGIASSAR